MAAEDVTEPAVQVLIAAINAGDREAFFAALTPDATMSDAGTDRDLASTGWSAPDTSSAPSPPEDLATLNSLLQQVLTGIEDRSSPQ